jgi:hypothetical protein
MRKILLSSIILFIAVVSNAQKSDSKIGLNVGAELGFATGSLNSFYSIGLGATAQLEYSVNDQTTITANSGIIQYVGRKIPTLLAPGLLASKYRNAAVVPVLAGVKYNFAENFYGAAELGFSIFTGASGFGSKFTYVPGLGFKINEKLGAFIKYTGYSNLGGAFGARIYYSL